MNDRQEGPVPAELQALAAEAMAVLAPHEQRVVQDALEPYERLEQLTRYNRPERIGDRFRSHSQASAGMEGGGA